MASPQMENGWLGIAKELQAALNQCYLGGERSRVVLGAILLQTYGSECTEAYISTGYLEAHTGIDRRNLQKTLRDLEKKNIIKVTRGRGTQPNKFTVNKDYDTWKPSKWLQNPEHICSKFRSRKERSIASPGMLKSNRTSNTLFDTDLSNKMLPECARCVPGDAASSVPGDNANKFCSANIVKHNASSVPGDAPSENKNGSSECARCVPGDAASSVPGDAQKKRTIDKLDRPSVHLPLATTPQLQDRTNEKDLQKKPTNQPTLPAAFPSVVDLLSDPQSVPLATPEHGWQGFGQHIHQNLLPGVPLINFKLKKFLRWGEQILRGPVTEQVLHDTFAFAFAALLHQRRGQKIDRAWSYWQSIVENHLQHALQWQKTRDIAARNGWPDPGPYTFRPEEHTDENP